jgi:hypothetical protein
MMPAAKQGKLNKPIVFRHMCTTYRCFVHGNSVTYSTSDVITKHRKAPVN